MRPEGPFGPRGAQVTVAWLDEPAGADPAALATAHQHLRDSGLLPLHRRVLQWRGAPAPLPDVPLWTLVQEERFGDFWADQLPLLQQDGWQIVVRPGFAHESVPVQAWRLVLDATSGEVLGQAVAAPMAGRPARVTALRQPHGEGSWLLSLGVEVDGQVLDLAPLLAGLLQRDRRWLDAEQLAAIDDAEVVKLRAPGGRRLHAPAAPLKAIVGALLDLITDPRRREGPIALHGWEAHRLEALRLALAGDPARRAGPHGAWALQGEAGLQALARRLQAAGGLPDLPLPAGLGVTLRPYQHHGVAWLQHLRAQHLAGILADDMGLGKTAQTLAHLLIEKHAGRLADAPALVVVPASLLFNWQAEARRMAPELRVLLLQGPRRGTEQARIDGHDLVLTSYPLLWRDIRVLESRPWHLLVLDEAQMVKNAGSRTARAVRRVPARHRLCLTGTPLENHLGELWAQFDFLLPGFLGDRRQFQQQWRRPIEKNGETARAALLAARVRPFILRRRKDQVELELPPLTETIERLPLEGGQRALYESVRVAADDQVRKVLDRSGFAGAQIAILDALLKLRQVCCDPRLVKGPRSPPPPENAKLGWLREHLPTLVAEGRRVLVFSQFTELLGLLQPELDALGLRWLALTGQTPPTERGQVVARFQAGEVPLLLASLKAGGVGLNLTAADTVIHLDPWWNPAVERQATARAHRIGQQRPVFSHLLVAEGSIEERLLELQARKQALADGVLGEDAALAPKFGQAELDALLAPLG
ncbi:DEAD/DEAH box helicase [Ideonella sp. A 288]|uniref:DEAD/DEAH box helicase n=1 Tax=Ideonella sp. A 288 TaxID=1962181 RepID=UPI000B4BFDFB|nr:DEAD/DEAH box helicase [Ideonella sp. A 288]